MKVNTKHTFAALFSLAFAFTLTDCTKQEIPSWGSTDYVRLVGPSNWTLDTDSMTYSFAGTPESNSVFNVEAKVYVEGLNSETDRTIYINIDKETTAVAGSYEIPASVVIPAGKGYGELPIKLNRVKALKENAYILKVSIDDAKSDLKTGVSSWHTLSIKFSDILSKPKNWADLEEFFGASYSDTKYQFIIQTLGFGTFTYLQPGGMSWGEMWNYRLLVVGALRDYNEAHPGSPLTDEFGALVSFDY